MQVKDLGFDLNVQFATQDSVVDPDTGKADGEELAPALNLLDFELNLDAAASEIKISGNILTKLIGKVVNMFRGPILKYIVKEIE